MFIQRRRQQGTHLTVGVIAECPALLADDIGKISLELRSGGQLLVVVAPLWNTVVYDGLLRMFGHCTESMTCKELVIRDMPAGEVPGNKHTHTHRNLKFERRKNKLF